MLWMAITVLFTALTRSQTLPAIDEIKMEQSSDYDKAEPFVCKRPITCFLFIYDKNNPDRVKGHTVHHQMDVRFIIILSGWIFSAKIAKGQWWCHGRVHGGDDQICDWGIRRLKSRIWSKLTPLNTRWIIVATRSSKCVWPNSWRNWQRLGGKGELENALDDK